MSELILCELNPSKFKDLMNEGIVLDVRTIEEYKEFRIGKPLLIDYYDTTFDKKLLELNKEKMYFIYCKSGIRSLSAANFMLNNGFKKIYHLTGGIDAWKECIN